MSFGLNRFSVLFGLKGVGFVVCGVFCVLFAIAHLVLIWFSRDCMPSSMSFWSICFGFGINVSPLWSSNNSVLLSVYEDKFTTQLEI